MTGVKKWRSRNGREFRIEVNSTVIPDAAEYWKYVVVATDVAGPVLTFVVILRKRRYPTQTSADAGVLADPLIHIKAILGTADQDGRDLKWPSFEGDWMVV